jgi:TonB-dependent starch-binding outer membrane protein SusC
MKYWYLVLAIVCHCTTIVRGQYADLYCNPCALDSLLNVWNTRHPKSVLYSKSGVKKWADPVYVNCINADYKTMVAAVFKKQTRLDYYFKNEILIICRKKGRKHAFENHVDCKTVKVKVLDKAGLPLAFASAELKGKGQMVADGFGSFETEWCRGDVLVITHVNYNRKEVAWQDSTELTVQMEIRDAPFEALIFRGFTEENSLKNIATVSKIPLDFPNYTDVLEALRGRVPGALISLTSGISGASYSLQLRGQNSIGAIPGRHQRPANDPLIILDGIPMPTMLRAINQLTSMAGDPKAAGISAVGLNPLFTLNIQDVESIKVLKGAEATAIYGARGANGVVIIQTKRALHSAPLWNVYYSQGIGKSLPVVDLMNTDQYRQMRKDAFENDGISLLTPENAADLLLWDSTRFTDYKKWLLNGRATYVDGYVSFSNGNRGLRYLASGSYHHGTSVLPGDIFDRRWSITGNFAYSSDNNKFHTGVSAFASWTRNKWLTENPMYAMLLAPNTPTLQNSDGTLKWQQDSISYFNSLSYFKKPLVINTSNYLVHAYLGYELLPGVNAELSFGYNNSLTNEEARNPIEAHNPADRVTGSFILARNRYGTLNIEPKLQYNFSVRSLKLQTLLGGSWLDQINKRGLDTYSGYTDDALLGNTRIDSTAVKTSENIKYRFHSVFARLQLGLQNSYFLSLTGRLDMSSRFGPDNRMGQFGSIGAGWVLRNSDSAYGKSRILTFVKLRGSYGLTGNDQIGDYKFLTVYSNTNAQPYQGFSGITPLGPTNPHYQWEKNRKLEIALETGFFKKNILFTLIYYNNRSYNQLIDYLLPAITGFGAVTSNFSAVVQNSGIEFEADFHKVGKHFTWDGQFTLAIPRNKLVRFPGLELSNYRRSLIIGKSLSSDSLFRYTGIDPQTGEYTFKDSSDKIVKNSFDPAAFGNFSQTLTIARFQIEASFEFRFQTSIHYQAYLYNFMAPGTNDGTFLSNQSVDMANHWQKNDTRGQWQKFSTKSGGSVSKAISKWPSSDAAIVNGSFLRCRRLGVRFFLPPALTQKAGLKSGYIFSNVENVFTISPYKGADPEIANPLVLPPLRIFSLGFKVAI